MREPKTIDDAKEALSEMASENPTEVLMTLIDELITLVCRGGSPIATPLEEFNRLHLYKSVIARILLRRKK